MQVTARVDYALRAMLTLAAAEPAIVKAQVLADTQQMPIKYLYSVLAELRRADLVCSRRGAVGGYTLSRPATEICLDDVVRAVDGTLTSVNGVPAERARYGGPAMLLREVWLAAGKATLHVLGEVSLAHLVAGRLPPHVQRLADEPVGPRA